MSATGGNLDVAGKAAGGRKLIAVVYADMVGYSRLIGLDDAGTLRRLRTLRRALIDPAIREHGGRVVQTGGDSLLVAFDSIDGAARCAVKVQQQVPVYDSDQPPDRRIRFRIGINIGDVIPHGTDLHGDGVNIAARLEAECPVGGICVSRTVRDHVHGRLDLPFEAIGPLTLKNIARPVEAFVLRLDPAAEALAPTPSVQRSVKIRSCAPLVAGIAGLLLLGAGGAGWWLYGGTAALQHVQSSSPAPTPGFAPVDAGLAKAPRQSIVVLPFQNLSGDAAQEYLADGVTEDLTTDLANLPGMYVVSRQSAYTYKDKALDLRKVGEELGVRYALEGSVRKLGDVLRVNAQLISTETEAHLWAERFDQPIKDLGEGPEEIVRRISQTLEVALIDVEAARSKRERPANPDAADLILRARSLALHPMGSRENSERIALYEQALRLDPTAIGALAGLAEVLIRDATTGDEFERPVKLLAQAAAINPDNSGVLSSTGFMLLRQNRCTEAIVVYQRLLAEYPNSPFAYNQIGDCLSRLGRPAEAVPMIETAIRTEPRSPYNYSRYSNLAWALLMLGRDEESITWDQRAVAAANPGYWPDEIARWHIRMAAANARLGRMDEAHRELATANRIWPFDTVRSHSPDDPFARPAAEQIEIYQATLRLAGHRDHAEEDADFGMVPDDKLRPDLAGQTPTSVPGATTIHTTDLKRLLAEQKPVVIDPLLYWWGRSLPGAVGLEGSGSGIDLHSIPERLRKKMQELTKGYASAPIVAVGWNSERFDGRNLALRLVSLGYSHVYWYRGGREAWEVNGLPEAELTPQDW